MKNKKNNKNNLFLLACLLGFAIVFPACSVNVLHGSGPKGVNAPQVAVFDAVDISVPMKASITVQPGAVPSVQLAGYQNLLAHIKVKVEDSTLIIYTDGDNFWTGGDSDQITAQIILPSVVGISLSGSADAVVHGPVACDSFGLDISGSGSVWVDSMSVTYFSTSISGSGDLEVNGGTAKYADYSISGQADIKAFPLQTEETTMSVSGQGDGEVTATKTLDASISGQGDIKYKGHPTISRQVSGQGTIKDAN